MTPAPPASARILELGCGTGANLFPLALDHPNATIVGCDLAHTAIASAKGMAAALRLANLDFRQVDLADVDEGWGEFDYILCHDVFSWVTPETRNRILEICRNNLAPEGVGFISHDALPGWRLHGVAREMMRYHTRHLDASPDIVGPARLVLAMAAAVQEGKPGTYASLLRDEFAVMSAIADAPLYHLVSSPHHQAFYFHEFVERLTGAALQWIGDAAPSTDWCADDAPAFLRELPLQEQQQYADFFDNCAFRPAVVCRAAVPLRRRPDEEVLRRLWIGLTSGTVLETAPGSDETRLRANGREVGTRDTALRRMLLRLDEARPELLPCSQMFVADAPLPIDCLTAAIGRGVIEGVLTPFNVTGSIGECPRASPLARLQARDDVVVTNTKSEPVRLNVLTRQVVQQLDGTRNRRTLADDLARYLRSAAFHTGGELVIHDTAADPADLIDTCLRSCRDHALLLPDGGSSEP
jgi:SAM-dependent methyltransferase